MKIAYIVGEFPSVSETFVLNQMVGMAERGLEIEIHALRPSSELPVHERIRQAGLLKKVRYRRATPRNKWRAWFCTAGMFVRYLPRFNMLMAVLKAGRADPDARFYSYLALAESLWNCDADIVHAQFGQLGKRVAALKQAGVFPGKLVVAFRGGDTTIILKRNPGTYRQLYRVADRLLPVSRRLMQMHIDSGCPPDKLEVHHSGIDLALFQYSGRRVPVPGEPIRLLAVGRLVEKKGHRYAIEALRLFKEAGGMATMRIVGEGPLRPRLEQQIDETGLGQDIVLTGWMRHDEVVEEMRRADVLLAPCVTAENGDEEGIPNFVKEAMAVGLPVVATEHGGMNELVGHGVSGWLVPERDAAALAHALCSIFGRDQEQLRTTAGNARHCIENEFDMVKLNHRLADIYHGLFE